MKTADDILREHRVQLRSSAPGRYYSTCPECSHLRKPAHRKSKCLGVTITHDGVKMGCNHCTFTGGGYFADQQFTERASSTGVRGPRDQRRNSREIGSLYR